MPDYRVAATDPAVGHGHATLADTANTLVFSGMINRSVFRWKDADEIYVGAGRYGHIGTKNQFVWWDSELTVQLSGAAADTWYYLYLDDSAIVTAGTPVLTASEFVFSTTAPAWSATKHGYYNGADRCIFAVLTDGGGAILEFFHDGDLVVWADDILSLNATDIDTTWEDVTLDAPGFCRRVLIYAGSDYVDGTSGLYWRTNGQTASGGHQLNYIGSTSIRGRTEAVVITDATQKIEIKHNASNGNTCSVQSRGWLFPVGM